VAAELLAEPRPGGSPKRCQIGDRDPHAVDCIEIPHDDPDRRLGRDPGVDDSQPARPLADKARQEIGHERHERLRPEVLAPRVADEGRVVAERDDRRDEHRQRLGNTPPKLSGDQVVGPEREVWPVLLGRRPYRYHDDGSRGDARPGLRPAQILQERPPHLPHLSWSRCMVPNMRPVMRPISQCRFYALTVIV
jgi:hypothetical protein